MADVKSKAQELPEFWNGHPLNNEVASLLKDADDVSAAAGVVLIAAKGKPAAADISKPVVQGVAATERARSNDLSPGFTLPWNYQNGGIASLIYSLTATLLLLVGLSVILRNSGGLRFFFIGGDGRISTSQTQAAIWTVAVVFVVAALVLRANPGKFDQLDENYLLLLGGPYAAWVISGAVTRGKLDNASIQKVVAPEAQLKDLVSDDDGRANLSDAQFLIFSMVALVAVLIAFLKDPSNVPAIPTGLAMLTSAGALVYTGKKILDRNPPRIFSVSPDRSRRGGLIGV